MSFIRRAERIEMACHSEAERSEGEESPSTVYFCIDVPLNLASLCGAGCYPCPVKIYYEI